MKNYCLEKDIDRLLKEIKSISKNKENANYILENTYFLKDGRVLSLPRQNGVSRFPYGTDGFTLWAYSSGYISINESTFYLVLPSEEGKEPYLAFYGGEKQKDGRFVPISIMGRASNPLEGDNVKRYVIYSKECVYYITETIKAVYAVRIYVTDNKEVAFTTLAKNKTNKNLIYLLILIVYLNTLIEKQWKLNGSKNVLIKTIHLHLNHQKISIVRLTLITTALSIENMSMVNHQQFIILQVELSTWVQLKMALSIQYL